MPSTVTPTGNAAAATKAAANAAAIAAAIAIAQKRKRKRDRVATGGTNTTTSTGMPELPDIPGVPMEVVPLLVHALRMSNKYFQQHAITTTVQEPFSKRKQKNDDASSSRTRETTTTDTSTSIVHQLMIRMEHTADATRTNEAAIQKQQQLRERQHKMELALEAWLEIVQRFVRNDKARLKNQQQQQQQQQDAQEQQQSTAGATTTTSATTTAATTSAATAATTTRATYTERPSVALSCFLYMWELQLEHSKLAVRRTALHLCGLLLERSRECRVQLLGGGGGSNDNDDNNNNDEDDPQKQHHLNHWISQLVTGDGLQGTEDEDQEQQQQQQLSLWQCEAQLLLTHLIDQGYDTLYPKLSVAQRRLRQLCPNHPIRTSANNDYDEQQALSNSNWSSNNNSHTHNNTHNNNNMVDWRQARDVALLHGTKELKRVRTIIQRTYDCLDILVPRIGMEYERSSSSSRHHHNERRLAESGSKGIAKVTAAAGPGPGPRQSPQEDDDDEEEDIDWEDGDDDNDDESANNKESSHMNDPESHVDAVERTLAVMEASGGLQKGGVDIVFGGDDGTGISDDSKYLVHGDKALLPPPSTTLTDNYYTANDGDALVVDHAPTLQRLQRCVAVLSQRHMPRLSTWVEGLTHADNLMLPSTASSTSSSLVLLPTELSRQRQDLLAKLVEVKRTVASVLSAAGKVVPTTPSDTTDPSEQPAAAPPPRRRPLLLSGGGGRRPAGGLHWMEGDATRHSNLVSSVRRPPQQGLQRTTTKKNSSTRGRIQIKYRST